MIMEIYYKSDKSYSKVIVLFTILLFGCLNLFPKNNALLIGIGNYDTEATGWKKIHGNNDISLLRSKLENKGFYVVTLTDHQATKENIKKALENLVYTASTGDVIYLHFSGHGQLIEDLNNDEKEGWDQTFVCYDACFSPKYKIKSQEYHGQNHLIDDELFPFLNEIKRKIGKKGKVFVIFDTCYSGGEDRGEMTDEAGSDSEVIWSNNTRGTDDEFEINKSVETYLRSINKPGNYINGRGDITIISACESDKKNYECKELRSGRMYGSLSYCIGKMLDQNIPMTQWEDFFINKKYKNLRIFRSTQNPVVERYK